jgi:hypothetical protein
MIIPMKKYKDIKNNITLNKILSMKIEKKAIRTRIKN